MTRSSEAGAEGAAPRRAYAFEQLEAPPPPPPVVPAPRAAAATARAEAETLLARAQAEAEGLRAEARARGRDEGYRAGLEAAAEQVAPAAAALAEAGAALEADRRRVAEALERQAVDLALQTAEKVVGGTLAVEPERVLDVVRGALRGMVERERVVVQVNPDDLELVRGAVDEVSSSLGGIDRLEVHAERRVERGGAVVRTPVGEIDAQIPAKLARAREVVEAELGS